MELRLRRALAVAASLALAPRAADAMGAVVGSSAHPVSMARARLAVATTPARTVRWARIEVVGDTDGFAWLLPLLPGTRVDLASDAWLDALDAATTPVVLPPPDPPACPVSLAPSEVAPALTPASRVPSRGVVALDAPSLASVVATAGFEIPPALSAALDGVFAAGSAVVVLAYAPGSLPVHTVRLEDAGPATLPLSLASAGAGSFPVTAFVVADGPRRAGASALAIDPSTVVWFADGTTSYPTDVAARLSSSGGTAWLTESAEPTAFSRATEIQPSLTLPAVLEDYYALASAYGDASADPAACTAAADATIGSGPAYASACTLGALAVVPGASPCAASPPDATPITGLVCGAASDAALAVGGVPPSAVWITRVEGLVTPAAATDVSVESAGAAAEPVFFTAGSYAAGCAPGDGGAAGGGEGGFGWGEGGAGEGGPGDPLGGLGEGGAVLSSVGDVGSVASDGCGGSSTTTDTSGSSGGGCGGDTSSTDASGGSADSGCGGSGAGSDTSGGCSGDTGSSGDSGGCSGGDTTSSSNCSTVRRRGHGKSPVSRILLVVAAGLGLARRRRRRAASAT